MSHAAWNERQLNRPVINTQLLKAPELDLTALRSLLERGIAATFAVAQFNEVAALASRLIARRSASFRAQYGFRLMRQTNTALCRLHECAVTADLQELLASLPAYRLTAKAALELPTRDHFDYVLVRLRSLATLLARIARCARQSSELFLYYLHRKYFLETAVVHVAVLAEVWQKAQRLGANCVQFYAELRPFARHFGSEQQWLQQEMPTSLTECLGEEWREECRRAKQGAKFAALPVDLEADGLLGFGRNDADGDCIVEMEIADQAPAAVAKKPAAPKVKIAKVEQAPLSAKSSSVTVASSLLLAADDIGQVIERKPAKPQLLLEQLVSTDDVQAFVRAERKRLAYDEKRWKEIQRKVNHILVTTQGKNTVRAFRKYWSVTVLNKVVR